MRDEMDSRIWVDNHEAFSRDLERAFASVRLGLGRLWNWDGSTHQLLALIAAFLITGLSFNSTAT